MLADVREIVAEQVKRALVRQAAAAGLRHLLGHDDAREVVAALAAVLLRVGEAEEAELAHAGEDPVGERVLLELL